MANLKFVILAASVAFFISSSHAGYANLQPPPGFITSSSGVTTYTKSANNVPFNTNTVRTNAALNVGGRAVTIPTYARVAANAATLMAPLLFRNPWIAGAIAVAGIYWSTTSNQWEETIPGGPTTQYRVEVLEPRDIWSDSAVATCTIAISYMNVSPGHLEFFEVQHDQTADVCVWKYYNSNNNYEFNSRSVIRTRPGPYSEPQSLPVSEPKFNSDVVPTIVPPTIPDLIPNGVPIPVSPPVINPSADPDPVPQPFRVPVGDPVPIPNTDPQQWRNPVVDIVPSPTLLEPWRVDLQPRDIIKLDPSPITSTVIDSVNNPNETPQEKAPGLCEQFPDILACQKPNLDTPSTDQIQTKDAAISITPDSGWGADNATCPPARHLSGANVDFEFTTICNFMSGFRPVMIAVSWLIAAMILIGFKRGE